ncbi:MAG: VTT domain-containing protein [Candidatus Korarchaeota archaeon]
MKKIDWFAIVSLTVLGIISVILLTNEDLGLQFTIMGEELINSFKNLTDPIFVFIGIFLATLIANLTVFIYVPYGVLILFFAATGIDPILLALAGASGAAIGEISSYAAGRLGYKIAEKKRKYRRQLMELNTLFEKHPKTVPFLVYIMAATPLPDDLLLVPLGLVKYSPAKSIIPCFLGKFTMILALSVGGQFFGSILAGGEVSPLGWVDDMVVLVLLVLIVWFAFRVDFGSIVKKITGDESLKIFLEESSTNDVPVIKKDLRKLLLKSLSTKRVVTGSELNDILVVPNDILLKAMNAAATVKGCTLDTQNSPVLYLEPDVDVDMIISKIVETFEEYISISEKKNIS